MRKARCYIAGPISTVEDYKPAFQEAADKLRRNGWEVVSPPEVDEENGRDGVRKGDPRYPEIILDCLRSLAELNLDAIFTLPGWEESTGASAEVAYGHAIGLDIYEMYPVSAYTSATDSITYSTDSNAASGNARTFDTGATRDTDEGKPDYEGFLSPDVIEAFGRYMHAHRVQSDGELRDSDNWQKGIPQDAYMKSAWRHFMDWWAGHRGQRTPEEIEEALCALLFNVQGYLHESIKREERG